MLDQLPTADQTSVQRLSLHDELCQIFTDISDGCVFILDNADDILESGLPKVKEEVMQLLEQILTRNENVTFVLTTRESFEFMDLHFRGHQSVRIRPLDEVSSKSLVQELLPNASTLDCTRITQICGHVPLAIKLLCSLISEDDAQPSQFLEDFMISSTGSIAEILDNPDYPTDHRLQFLFDSSFQRLSAREKEALVSLCILPESFNIGVAAAVLGERRNFETRKILQSLRRKSLLDSSSISGSFTMHKLLQSFVREKGEHDMKETLLNSTRRFYVFYISLFEKLNDQFLTGHSMSAYIAFYEDRQCIVQSLIEGCSDSKIADSVFELLVKAELFLDLLFYDSGESYYKIFDSAIEAAKKVDAKEFYCRLLVSKAFAQAYHGAEGWTMQLLSKASKTQTSSSSPPSSIFNSGKGKNMCYSGICQLVDGKIENGIQCLQEALLLMNKSPEQTVLALIIFQILSVYYQFLNNFSRSAYFYNKALQQCKTAGDTELLVIPPPAREEKTICEKRKPDRDMDILLNQPIKLLIIFLLSEATNHFSLTDTKQYLSNIALQTLNEIETKAPVSLGLFNLQRNADALLTSFNPVVQNPIKLYEARLSYYQTALKQCNNCKGSATEQEGNPVYPYQAHSEELAKCYLDLGKFQRKENNYLGALQSEQHALDLTRELHAATAGSYHELGVTQHELGDLTSAFQSMQRALDIRLKLFGEEHAATADSYRELGITQHKLGDLKSAFQSNQRALDIRLKLFGEEHAATADSYRELGITQHKLGDLKSAFQSNQRALDIRLKLFGEEHAATADSYRSLGVTQHELGDLKSAFQSNQRALDIRLKLFGEEHAATADSYRSLGVTQHELGDLTSAFQSMQRALDIRLKLFGEEHAATADSYRELGITQHKLGDLKSAFQSNQRALDIRLNCLEKNTQPQLTVTAHLGSHSMS